ncbi:MAG: flagellar biosynthetic protein FliR [Micrococcales bacterium]|nr:flagellar biosynthetic protein FliR [Micrococcales bacterium]
MIELLVERFQPLLPIFLLASVRIGVALAAMPAPFGDLAPVKVRTAIGILLAVAVCLPFAERTPAVALEAVPLARAAVGETLVGAMIGLTGRVTLAAAQVAGTLAGTSMGLGFASSIDPTFGEEALPTTRVLGALATLIFFAMRGHHAVLAALSESLRVAPVGHAFGAVAHEGLFRLGSVTMSHGLRIAAPVVATLFIVQLGTSLVSRAAPRLNLFALSFAVSIAAGLLTLFVAGPSLSRALATDVATLPELLRSVLAR